MVYQARVRVTINGEQKEIPDGLTVRGVVEHLGLTGPVAVEKNREIVVRANHVSELVKEGDSLEIVHFVGGG